MEETKNNVGDCLFEDMEQDKVHYFYPLISHKERINNISFPIDTPFYQSLYTILKVLFLNKV